MADGLPGMVVLLVCSLSFLVEVRASFKYPKNLAELKRLESATAVNRNWASVDDRAEDVLDRLSAELKRGQEKLNDKIGSSGNDEEIEKVKQHVALVRSYMEVANVRESRCQESEVSDLVFLINFHTGQKNSKDLLNYLKYFTWRQLQLCKPIWDKNFKFALEVQLSDESRANVPILIDQLMSRVLEPRTRRTPQRPYSRWHLDRLSMKIPRQGLLLFMSHTGNLVLDEQLRSDMYKDDYDGFLKMVDEDLMPTCSEVCEKVKPVVSPYSLMFNRDLMDADQVKSLFPVKENDLLLEWMAATRICCSVVQARNQTGQQSANLLLEAFSKLAKDDPVVERFMARMFGTR